MKEKIEHRSAWQPNARGFLPAADPLIELSAQPSPALAEWQAFAAELHKLLLSDYLRARVRRLPPFPVDELHDEAQLWRAASILGYCTNLYVHGNDGKLEPRLPAVVAQPFVAIARRLGVPPILSYALQAMVNWRRIEADGAIAVGNLTLLQNFYGGMDEEWFVTLHINIEARAGAAIAVLLPLQQAVQAEDGPQIIDHLQTIAATLAAIEQLLCRMPERCDPDIYYHRVRPFMFGWKDNPALPDGVVYEGVNDNRPLQLRGETGAQSSVIYAIDAALGVVHQQDAMRIFLNELRAYMPPAHRRFIQQLEEGPSLREFVQRRNAVELTDAYNEAIDRLAGFRKRHIEFAARYILKPAKQTQAVGTGGTPFTFYLKKHVQETEQRRL